MSEVCSQQCILAAVQLRASTASALQAGGGIASKTDKAGSTLTKLIAKGMQLAIVSSLKPSSDAGVKMLVRAKVPCATCQFLVDWLAHPQANLSSHMLFGSKVAWSAELQHAHQSRSTLA